MMTNGNSENWCSALGFEEFLMTYLGTELRPACVSHDQCYSLTNSNHEKCDAIQRVNAEVICNAYAVSHWEQLRCWTEMNTQWAFVRMGGNSAFTGAQENSCS